MPSLSTSSTGTTVIAASFPIHRDPKDGLLSDVSKRSLLMIPLLIDYFTAPGIFPESHRCLAFSKYVSQYGPLTRTSHPPPLSHVISSIVITDLSILGTRILIINSYDEATELLDKKGHIYSDRPELPFAGQLVGYDENTAFCYFNPTWKKHRKFLKHALNAKVIKQDYASLQEKKAYEYVQVVLERPADFLEAIKRYVTLTSSYVVEKG